MYISFPNALHALLTVILSAPILNRMGKEEDHNPVSPISHIRQRKDVLQRCWMNDLTAIIHSRPQRDGIIFCWPRRFLLTPRYELHVFAWEFEHARQRIHTSTIFATGLFSQGQNLNPAGYYCLAMETVDLSGSSWMRTCSRHFFITVFLFAVKAAVQKKKKKSPLFAAHKKTDSFFLTFQQVC